MVVSTNTVTKVIEQKLLLHHTLAGSPRITLKRSGRKEASCFVSRRIFTGHKRLVVLITFRTNMRMTVFNIVAHDMHQIGPLAGWRGRRGDSFFRTMEGGVVLPKYEGGRGCSFRCMEGREGRIRSPGTMQAFIVGICLFCWEYERE